MERPRAADIWLFSERADFWAVSAGGGAVVIVTALVLLWWGDYELSAADLILGELHLGATYDAIVRPSVVAPDAARRAGDTAGHPAHDLRPALDDRALLVTTTILYFGAWHRGRQSLGIAQYYQRRVGEPVSWPHRRLLQASFYLPMVAAVAYYASTAPTHDGEAFHGLSLHPDILWALASAATVSVMAYLAWTMRRSAGAVHPAERWLVLSNALGFGSAYILGAWTWSFVLALAVHHEVQYLCFTYAVAGHPRLARFARWPAIGLASWAICKVSGLGALEPFLTAGLLGHYWLDGRIWTARARSLGAPA